ncbi:hypothetical protein MNB_SUP05-13-632 [hydrothermal vent metagenome]|uniref:DUF3291 domain-containing protein n=1 Tax=hydrothermal vent metagenome TaxID=652676 RepID=A0A1W1DGR4_9ZZZZ
MFAVTTRNKLRSPLYVPHMIRAWLRVRKQLYETPGMLRYSTGIANLTEFYTLTLWETEAEMFAFMSSGAHREMMWNFKRWSDSFWAMRWDASADELGFWDVPGAKHIDSFAAIQNKSKGSTKQDIGHNYVAEWLVSHHVLKKEEAPLEPSPGIPGTAAVVIRVPIDNLAAFIKLQNVLRPWRKNSPSELLRFSMTLGIGESLIIAIWKANALEESRALMATVLRKFPDAWTMRFRGHDYEVGHWDDLRLREILLEKNPLE